MQEEIDALRAALKAKTKELEAAHAQIEKLVKVPVDHLTKHLEEKLRAVLAEPATFVPPKREREWSEEVEGVVIDRIEGTAGWAIFTGIEGEDQNFACFIPGSDEGRMLVAHLMALTRHDVVGMGTDPEDDASKWFWDADAFPAVLVSGLNVDGGLFAANDGRKEKSIRVLAAVFPVDVEDFGDDPPEDPV